MSAFAFDTSASDDDSPARSRSSQPRGPSWLYHFSATFAAVLLAGLLLLIGVRLYVQWSIADALKGADKPPAKVAK